MACGDWSPHGKSLSDTMAILDRVFWLINSAVLVVIVASLLSILRSRSPMRARQVVTAASVVVTLAGAYWFVQRIW